jgi:hypothetical protein
MATPVPKGFTRITIEDSTSYAPRVLYLVEGTVSWDAKVDVQREPDGRWPDTNGSFKLWGKYPNRAQREELKALKKALKKVRP